MSLQRLHHFLLHILDNFRERRRWQKTPHNTEPRVYYGQPRIPKRTEQLGGGLVKVQDLITRYPNILERPNLCYLVSSALPPNPDLIIRHAHKAKAKIILNQNGVAYQGWHGPGWEETNKRLAQIYHAADFIIFQSKFCKTGAEIFLGTTKIPNIILHNPVDIDLFTPLNNKPTKKEIMLLVAGTHHFFYRVQTAVETLHNLSKQDFSFRLRIAGRCCWQHTESACHSEVKALARTLHLEEKIECTGAYTQEESIAIFQNADILLHPQYNDSCPRIVVEAMACGLPVVYSASGGIPELIPPSAGIGIPAPLDWESVHPPSPKRMAAAVAEILSGYEVFSHEARTHAAVHFSVKNWLDEHEHIFKTLLAAPKTH
ncbi:glycosyltransferase family 4 protein [Desulfobulbus alkaliphilus]|uniref:glycosyltransferase family 4 protein n=1 Tax=Desulfobulbus alkaliphilus TaxID=869814 RepID=UPI00196375B9|nr:glycosyltransferase family 4 protein [Desulfobulbus alkaliphilus]MBM9538197.1 glycosyltransferase family 4 protein [Desulfobulbus alkaliphilus]